MDIEQIPEDLRGRYQEAQRGLPFSAYWGVADMIERIAKLEGAATPRNGAVESMLASLGMPYNGFDKDGDRP